MSLPADDRETSFTWDDSTKTCQLITFNKALLHKLDKYCKDYPTVFKKTGDQIFDEIKEGAEYEFPKNLISIRQPSKKKEMTDEQKKATAERLQKARKPRTKKVKEIISEDSIN